MKNMLNIGLLALLLVVTYQQNTFLNNLVDNMVGKSIMLGLLYFVVTKYGQTSGVLTALIFLVLMVQKSEGFGCEGFTDLEEDKKRVVKGNMNHRQHLTITDLENVMRHRSEVNTMNSSAE
tara:strand:+ start:2520 stop:2882 length:363 start_codon:yes stop_codon:yes gene_type:complete